MLGYGKIWPQEKISSGEILSKVCCSPVENEGSAPPWWWQLEGFDDFRKDFRRLRCEPVHPKVELTLTTALALDGVPFGSKGYHFKLHHPRYSFVGNRHQLRRVLRALALTDPHLDHHKDLAVLAATLLAVTNCEASAYAVLAFIQKKFSFKRLLFPTLDPDRQGSQGQAAMIISSYQRFCPVTYEAVRSAGLGQRLLEIVAQWLRSFFCTGFDPKRQSLQSFEQLLDAVLQVRVHQSDPYRELRQICLYILLRNSARLLVAFNADTLPAELESLAISIKVRKEFFQVLQEMNSSKMSLWSTDDMVAYMPVSLVAGWCCMLELDTLIPGSSLVIPAACACIGLMAGYMDGFKSLVNRFTPPPKDVTCDSIYWDVDEEPSSDEKVVSDPNPPVFDDDPEWVPDFRFFAGDDDPISNQLDDGPPAEVNAAENAADEAVRPQGHAVRRSQQKDTFRTRRGQR